MTNSTIMIRMFQFIGPPPSYSYESRKSGFHKIPEYQPADFADGGYQPQSMCSNSLVPITIEPSPSGLAFDALRSVPVRFDILICSSLASLSNYIKKVIQMGTKTDHPTCLFSLACRKRAMELSTTITSACPPPANFPGLPPSMFKE